MPEEIGRSKSQVGAFMAIDIGVGVALAATTGSMGTGIAIGVAIGLAIGAGVDASHRK